MAKNFKRDGDTLQMAAPYAVNSGDGALVGSIFGVALGTYANAAAGVFARSGVFAITCLATDVIAQGAKVYWDPIAKRMTGVVTANILVGAATVAKAAGETTVTVLLDGAVR